MIRAALMLLLFAAPMAAADATLEFDDGSVILVKDGRARIGDEESFMLYDDSAESILSVDTNEQAYMAMDAATMRDMQAASMAMIERQMEQALASMPPEQREAYREQMESMMRSQGMAPEAEGPASQVRATGESDEVSGFGCREHEVVSTGDGTVEQRLCVASADELGISESDFATLAAAMQTMIEVSGTMHEMDLEKLGGIPVRTVDTEEGETAHVVEVSTDRVPAERLQVPDGYREMKAGDMMKP